MKKYVHLTTFEQHLDKQYGKPGSKSRIEFEKRASLFLKHELKSASNKGKSK